MAVITPPFFIDCDLFTESISRRDSRMWRTLLRQKRMKTGKCQSLISSGVSNYVEIAAPAQSMMSATWCQILLKKNFLSDSVSHVYANKHTHLKVCPYSEKGLFSHDRGQKILQLICTYVHMFDWLHPGKRYNYRKLLYPDTFFLLCILQIRKRNNNKSAIVPPGAMAPSKW